MSRVSVAVDALNALISALEGIGRFAGMVRSVQSTVKKAQETPEEVAETVNEITEVAKEVVTDVVKNEIDKGAERVKNRLDRFAVNQLQLPIAEQNKS